MTESSWEFDEQSLMPRIIDREAFRREFLADPYANAIEALWAGSPESVPDLLKGETSMRARVLVAESYARVGEFVTSFELFSDLLDEFERTQREAVIRQHFGKALFLAEKYRQARVQFVAALGLRKESGADEGLIRSSELAIRRCDEEAAPDASVPAAVAE